MECQQLTDEDRTVSSEVPPPGPSLLSFFVRRGRPVYRPAPGIAVPCLEQVPGAHRFVVVPKERHCYRRAPQGVLRLRVAAWLDQPDAQGTRSHFLDTDDLAQLKALAAAALRDVAGLPEAAVREWIGLPTGSATRRVAIMSGVPSEDHQGDTRSTRRQIARGRRLWVRLAAWPWWAAVDAGEDVAAGMPRRWWELPRVVETHRTWLRLASDGTFI
jgi:hypothetical protein